MIGGYYVSSGGGGLLFLLLFGFLFFVLPMLFLRGLLGSSRVVMRRLEPYPEQYPQVPQPSPHAQPVHPAEVEAVVSRLAHDVRDLRPGDDGVARQAMADAAERHATASALLERASSQDQLRTAWLAAAEGLHATRLVRTRLGLDPGPAPALPPAQGPQLQQPSRVVVDGREHVGSPTYAPGYGHWFPGGQVGERYVPGGWYREPFWPGDLVLGALSGFALGSLMSSMLMPGFGFPYGLGGGWGGGDGWDAGGGGWDAGGGGWDGGGWDVGGGGWDGGGGDW